MSTPAAAPSAPTAIVTILDAVAPSVAKLAQKVPAKARLVVNAVLLAVQYLLANVLIPSGTPGWVEPTVAAVLAVAQAAFIAGNTDISKS